MSLFNSFQLAGSAMQAQTQRLNTVASNLANVETAASKPEDVYKPRKVIFEAAMEKATAGKAAMAQSVDVKQVTTQNVEPRKLYDPKHPMADEQGFVYMPNVSAVEEMVDMMSASRSYQSNAEVMNTAKSLMLKTLTIGQN